MRRTGRIGATGECGPHDHVCWPHEGALAWQEAAVRHLGEGARGNERLLYVADNDERGLVEDLAALPGRDALLDSGRLSVMSLADAYGPLEPLPTPSRLNRLVETAEDAVRSGYRGLRIASESSPLAAHERDARLLTAYELLVDEIAARTPLAVLCGYDRNLVEPVSSELLSFVHPLRRGDDAGGTGDPARPEEDGGLYADDDWRLSGQIDRRNSEALEVALAALAVSRGDRDVRLSLAELEFVDVAAVRALVGLAARLAPVRRLILLDPPTVLLRILRACWWGGVPGLEVARS